MINSMIVYPMNGTGYMTGTLTTDDRGNHLMRWWGSLLTKELNQTLEKEGSMT